MDKNQAHKSALEELSKLHNDMEYMLYSHKVITEMMKIGEKRLNELPSRYNKNRWLSYIGMGVLSSIAMNIFTNSKDIESDKERFKKYMNLSIEHAIDFLKEQEGATTNE